jgi:hypothetical protein
MALALVPALALGLTPSHTFAATTTVISDAASCNAFQGGSWDSNESACDVSDSITIAAGDTLQVPADLQDVTNNGTFTVSGRAFVATDSITNNAGATINGNGDVLRAYGASVNYGTINGNSNDQCQHRPNEYAWPITRCRRAYEPGHDYDLLPRRRY